MYVVALVSSQVGTTLSVGAVSGAQSSTQTLQAKLVSGQAPLPNETVEFRLNGQIVGSVATDASGTATLENVSLANIAHGTYATGVTASFAGDSTYGAATATASLTVAGQSQTITFGTLAGRTFGDPPFTVSATASSRLPVSFAATGACTIAGATVTVTGAGSCTITASQAGDGTGNPAPDVAQSFTIAKASQTISFPLIYGQKDSVPFQVSATASSGLPVTFSIVSGPATVSGTTVTMTGAGAVTIRASQAGNSNYAAANSDQTFAALGLPVATGLSPSSGLLTGGTVVSLTGTDCRRPTACKSTACPCRRPISPTRS